MLDKTLPFHLYFTTEDGPELAYTSSSLEDLIDCAMGQLAEWDGAHIEYPNGKLAWEPSLGKEHTQHNPPKEIGPEWWMDEYGLWHEIPC